MAHVFICPDCKREHDEPAEAAFVLTVRCLDCALHWERAEVDFVVETVSNAA